MNPENNEQPIEQVVPTPVTSTAYQAGPTLQANDVVRPQTVFSKTKVTHLLYALALGIVGFGTCTAILSNNTDESLLFFPGIMYLVSAIYALSSMIAVFRINPTNGLPYSRWMKVFVFILGLIVGGWGGVWGFVGIFYDSF